MEELFGFMALSQQLLLLLDLLESKNADKMIKPKKIKEIINLNKKIKNKVELIANS